ncbi:MAG: hypothetical protein ACI30A_06680 [Paludibacteraceae bacterium]
MQNTKNYVTQVVQKEYNHVVTAKTEIVTDKKGNTLSEYTVQCLLNNSSVSLISLSDISATEYSNTRKAVWNKSEDQTGLYANILIAQSTAGRGVLKLTIENTKENRTESHYICFIEDTPSQGVFLFATTCEWNIEVRQERNKIHAYLKIPDDFAGTITLQGVRCHLGAGSQWYVAQPETDGSPKAIFNMLADPNQYFCTDGNTYEMEFFTAPYGNPLTSGSFITPFGKYKTDIIYDFGAIKIGDKISDSVINDALLHGLKKQISSFQELAHEAQTTAEEAQNVANNAESIANNAESIANNAESIAQDAYNKALDAETIANEASANAYSALDTVSQFDPANFATAKHTHTTDEVSGLEDRLSNLELGSAIEELLVERQLTKIEMDTNTLEITTPDGEFEALRDVMFNILETEDSPDFNQFYQLFNGKQLLPYMEINVPDPDLGVTHYVRLLPWTIYLYNSILTDGTSPTSATPVLEIYFSNDTIQFLKDLSISERLNLSGEIYGLTYDNINRVLTYAVRDV